jgi:hypothetical protein
MRQVENRDLPVFTSEALGCFQICENPDAVEIKLSVFFIQPSADFPFVL